MISSSLKNINQFPSSIQAPITEFANKVLTILSDNLSAILVYGSTAGADYNPAVSNINIAVIVKDFNFSVLSQSLDLVKWGRKHKIATPLFLSKDYILHSLDVFPIEFSEIKEKHIVILGEDLFKDLDIPIKDVRLLCEQQVKGKLLHLRQAYLEIGTNAPVLKDLLLRTFNDLIPVFRQLIFLKGQKPFEKKEELLTQLAVIYSLDVNPLITILHDKNKKILISSHQLEAHLQNFLDQLEKLSRHMDSL